MAKKVRVAALSLDGYEFELQEDASKGDWFSIKDLLEFDTSKIETEITNLLENRYRKKLEQDKKHWENEFRLSDHYLQLKEAIDQLKLENEHLKKSLQEKIEQKEKLLHEEYKHQLQNYKQEYEYKLENIKQEYKHKDDQLNNERESLKKDHEYQKTILQQEFKNKEVTLTAQVEQEITKFKSKIEQDKFKEIEEFKKSYTEKYKTLNTNVKLLGEDLERRIKESFEESFGLLEDCRLVKQTTSHNSEEDDTRADFIFEIKSQKSNNFIPVVTIEAKTQSNLTVAGKKNSAHFNKLEKDAQKNQTQYALLVTELEPEEIISLQMVKEKNNMFMCRPDFTNTFLGLMRHLFKKNEELKLNIPDFAKKEDIQSRFEKMKTEILNNSVKNIRAKTEDILKHAESIKKDANKISESARIVGETHLETVVNKIEGFKLNSLLKAVED